MLLSSPFEKKNIPRPFYFNVVAEYIRYSRVIHAR